MKKVRKIILTIICWIGAIIFLVESINSYKQGDPWGLTFMFYTLPVGFIGILLFIAAINSTKEIIRNKIDK